METPAPRVPQEQPTSWEQPRSLFSAYEKPKDPSAKEKQGRSWRKQKKGYSKVWAALALLQKRMTARAPFTGAVLIGPGGLMSVDDIPAGSRAFAHHVPEQNLPKDTDWDIVIGVQTLFEWLKANPGIVAADHISIAERDGHARVACTIEGAKMDFIVPASPDEDCMYRSMLMSKYSAPTLHYPGTHVEKCGVAPLEVLYLLKRSHLYWRLNWQKHIRLLDTMRPYVKSIPGASALEPYIRAQQKSLGSFISYTSVFQLPPAAAHLAAEQVALLTTPKSRSEFEARQAGERDSALGALACWASGDGDMPIALEFLCTRSLCPIWLADYIIDNYGSLSRMPSPRPKATTAAASLPTSASEKLPLQPIDSTLFSGIPRDVNRYILPYLDARSLGRGERVCKRWQRCIQGWAQALYAAEFKLPAWTPKYLLDSYIWVSRYGIRAKQRAAAATVARPLPDNLAEAAWDRWMRNPPHRTTPYSAQQFTELKERLCSALQQPLVFRYSTHVDKRNQHRQVTVVLYGLHSDPTKPTYFCAQWSGHYYSARSASDESGWVCSLKLAVALNEQGAVPTQNYNEFVSSELHPVMNLPRYFALQVLVPPLQLDRDQQRYFI